MNFLDQLLKNRRSIRKYRPDPVNDENVLEMIKAALWAPSPSNSQPVRFIRIHEGARSSLAGALDDGLRRLLLEIEKTGKTRKLKNLVNAYFRFSRFMFDAPLLLAMGVPPIGQGFSRRLFDEGVICDDKRKTIDLDISTGMALMGFMLKAESLGIATCVLTAPLTFIRNPESILGLEGLTINCFLTAGYADESPDSPGRMDPSGACVEV